MQCDAGKDDTPKNAILVIPHYVREHANNVGGGKFSAWRNLRLNDMRVGIFELVAIAMWRNLRG